MKAVSQNVPDPGIVRCVELLSSAHNVLLVGDAAEELLHALDQRGCSIAYVLTGSMDEDEARIFATQVAVAPPHDLTIPPDLRASTPDAVVLCDPTDRLSDLANVLKEARHILTEDGIVVAGLGTPRFEIFTRAGYVIEGADDVRSVMGSLLVKARPAATAQLTTLRRAGTESVEALCLELEREQAARNQLLDALATAERSASDIQRKASDITARRSDDEAQVRALLGEREARLKLQIALLLSQHTIDAAQRDAAKAETAWYGLLTQLESTRADADKAFAQMRAMLENARRERDVAKAHVDRLTALEASSKERTAELQRRITGLEHDVTDGAAYVKRLLVELEAIRSASLADKAVMQAYADDVRERSERIVNELRTQVAEITERERRSVENLQTALRETESRLSAENRELRERVAAAEAVLAAQTDAVIATMQAESAQLSQLVDTVQSSHFWRFKRWLSRLRGALRS